MVTWGLEWMEKKKKKNCLWTDYYICSGYIIASNTLSSIVWSKPVMLHLQNKN